MMTDPINYNVMLTTYLFIYINVWKIIKYWIFVLFIILDNIHLHPPSSRGYPPVTTRDTINLPQTANVWAICGNHILEITTIVLVAFQCKYYSITWGWICMQENSIDMWKDKYEILYLTCFISIFKHFLGLSLFIIRPNISAIIRLIRG